MPIASADRAGPSRAVHRTTGHKDQGGCVMVESTPNFSFAACDLTAEGILDVHQISVWQQRNAVVVGAAPEG